MLRRGMVECATRVNTELLIGSQFVAECRVSPVLTFASAQRHPRSAKKGAWPCPCPLIHGQQTDADGTVAVIANFPSAALALIHLLLIRTRPYDDLMRAQASGVNGRTTNRPTQTSARHSIHALPRLFASSFRSSLANLHEFP